MPIMAGYTYVRWVHSRSSSDNFLHAQVCTYTLACWMCVCVFVCVVPIHNYAGSKQPSVRIMTMERYMTLDIVKHNTANTNTCSWSQSRDWTVVVAKADIFDLFQRNLEWINKLPYSPRYKIWPEPLQCKPCWYMPIDGQTAMIQAVDIFAVCANVPKDAVHKQCHGRGDMPFGCTYFPVLVIFRSFRYTCWPHAC